jgi:hypothetical protein
MIQAFSKILCLSNVQDRFGGITHQINAGALWEMPEEIPPQTIDQRPRIWKKQQLVHLLIQTDL